MKFVLFLLLALTGSAAHALGSKDRGVTGTYELLICKGPCSFSDHANVLRTAVVVILDRAMKREDIARMDPNYDSRYDKPKACYLLTDANRRVSGLTAWLLDGKMLSFTLNRSKDSWYSVRVELKGDLLSGVGNFWSAGVSPPPDFRPDTVVGRRRGPADISACKVS